MKKLLFFFLVFLFGYIGGVWANEVDFGLKGGMDFSAIDGTGGIIFGGNTGIGYDFGIFADFKITDFLYFRPEININQKGNYSNSDSVSPFNNLNSFALDYLEFSPLFKTKIFSIKNIIFNLLEGPEIELLGHGSNLNPYGYTFLNTNYPVRYNDFDYGLIFGISLELDNFVLDGQYDMGLNGIFENGINGFALKAGLNRAFVVSAGYKFLSL